MVELALQYGHLAPESLELEGQVHHWRFVGPVAAVVAAGKTRPGLKDSIKSIRLKPDGFRWSLVPFYLTTVVNFFLTEPASTVLSILSLPLGMDDEWAWRPVDR